MRSSLLMRCVLLFGLETVFLRECARRMVLLILFATARRHWTWLCGAIERLSQFSREACLHRAKKNEGSCTLSLGCNSAH